jgi:hypothetical protein
MTEVPTAPTAPSRQSRHNRYSACKRPSQRILRGHGSWDTRSPKELGVRPANCVHAGQSAGRLHSSAGHSIGRAFIIDRVP